MSLCTSITLTHTNIPTAFAERVFQDPSFPSSLARLLRKSSSTLYSEIAIELLDCIWWCSLRDELRDVVCRADIPRQVTMYLLSSDPVVIAKASRCLRCLCIHEGALASVSGAVDLADIVASEAASLCDNTDSLLVGGLTSAQHPVMGLIGTLAMSGDSSFSHTNIYAPSTVTTQSHTQV